MGKKKRIVIAEDHTIIRQGLKALLASSHDFEVVGEAEDGLEAIRCVERIEPDLLLLDLNMPRMDGISVIKDIKKRYPGVKIVALTMHKNEEYILSSFQSGVDGYCLKTSSHEELMMAIRAVLDGKRYVAPDVSEKVLEGYLEGKKTIILIRPLPIFFASARRQWKSTAPTLWKNWISIVPRHLPPTPLKRGLLLENRDS